MPAGLLVWTGPAQSVLVLLLLHQEPWMQRTLTGGGLTLKTHTKMPIQKLCINLINKICLQAALSQVQLFS